MFLPSIGEKKHWRCPKCKGINRKGTDYSSVEGSAGQEACKFCGEKVMRDFIYEVRLYDVEEVEGTCDNCGKSLQGVREEILGKPCPACGKLIPIPVQF